MGGLKVLHDDLPEMGQNVSLTLPAMGGLKDGFKLGNRVERASLTNPPSDGWVERVLSLR